MARGVGDGGVGWGGVGRHGGHEGRKGELENGASRAKMKRHDVRGTFEEGECMTLSF